MKKIILYLAFISIHIGIYAQDAKPTLLTVPEDWKFEFIGFPLDFAPSLQYQGYEELRFAPGMFDTTATDYFTYMFAIELEGKHDFGIPSTQKFLETYFKGLSYEVAKAKEISVDTSRIDVVVTKPDIRMGKHEGYFITVQFIDSFSGGKAVTLNMETVVLHPKNGEKTFIHSIVSPQPKYNEIWKELYKYRKFLMHENPVFVNAESK